MIWKKLHNDLLEHNKDCFTEDMDIQIMHNVSRGPLPIYESVFENGLEPTVTINTWPLINAYWQEVLINMRTEYIL